MARLIRPTRQWSPHLHHHYSNRETSAHFLSSTPPPQSPSFLAGSIFLFPSYFISSSPPRRRINLRKRSPAPPEALVPTVLQEKDEGDGDSGAEFDEKKSRNQRKREARRAVLWGMELASFSSDQIKRILRAGSLDEDVFDALMLVKRLGPDVREGKRRQFSYIGKLLRDVEPDLMDTLIHATKHGDQRTLQALLSSVKNDTDDVETHTDDKLEMSEEYISVATRWFDGLISKNAEVTNEVYSLQTVDFDRQELRKLVRKVHSVQEQCKTITQETEKGIDGAVKAAESALSRFLRALAKQMPSGQIDSYL